VGNFQEMKARLRLLCLLSFDIFVLAVLGLKLVVCMLLDLRLNDVLSAIERSKIDIRDFVSGDGDIL
jgi:hypothetical protein